MVKKVGPSFFLKTGTGLAGLLGATAALAQGATCTVAITHAAAPVAAAVPSLSQFGLAALGVGIAVLMWRQRKVPGARILSAAVVAMVGLATVHDGGDLLRKAYAATASIVTPAGTQNVTVPYGDTLTLTNLSGVPIVLSTVAPAVTGCAAGTMLANNAFCTTGPITCTTGGGDDNGGD